MRAISVQGVSKRFRMNSDKARSLKDAILRRGNRDVSRDFWALTDISFDVQHGETVALLGRNGSGKSTMLKLLSRILSPSCGQIETKGRLAGLLELGAGFQHDFSGRENIYMNASILGFSEREIRQRIDEIIDFSEISLDFIDTPVRNYSSGMYMRLAFSVAIMFEPEIFFIDEVLSVGDVAFQSKCMNRLWKMKKSGVTIVLVTHSEEVARTVCDRAIWLEKGRVQDDGPTNEVIPRYLAYMGH